jgi:hypothetical protein
MAPEHAGARVKQQPKPMRSEARYLQKLFKVTLPQPKEPTVDDVKRQVSKGRMV